MVGHWKPSGRGRIRSGSRQQFPPRLSKPAIPWWTGCPVPIPRSNVDQSCGEIRTLEAGIPCRPATCWEHGGLGQRGFSIQTESVCYRWNHSFSIPMTVPPRKSEEKFTQSAGGLHPDGRSPQGQRPGNPFPAPCVRKGPFASSGQHCPQSSDGNGEADELITLTDTCGRVYMGEFPA